MTRPPEYEKSLGAQAAWLDTTTGRSVLADERIAVARALEGVFGDFLLQVGCWGPRRLFIRNARVRHGYILDVDREKQPDVRGLPEELPISSDSVDAVILPHCLERSEDPHGLLREVNRILRPEGHLIVSVFNPGGWWGLRHVCSGRQFPPGTGRMISEKRLSDWLQLLGYAVDRVSYHGLNPPILRARRSPAERAAIATSDEDEQTLWKRIQVGASTGAEFVVGRLHGVSVFSASYVLVARKRLYTLTPVRPLPVRKRALVGGLVNPTTRNVA